VLAGLRDVNERADMIHVARDRWLVLTLDASDDLKRQGRNALENTKRAARAFCARHPEIDPREIDRITIGLKVAMLKSLGCRFVGFYNSRDPDGSIVEDYRRADFLSRHDTESEFFRRYEEPREKAREAQLKDLTDPARASDVWRYANTLNHQVGGKMTADLRPDRSSFRRAVTIKS
jgi:hypothetical protein